ncbi:MAG: hypothetical protein ABGW69_01120 [Nanoarchaeota archaeon]
MAENFFTLLKMFFDNISVNYFAPFTAFMAFVSIWLILYLGAKQLAGNDKQKLKALNLISLFIGLLTASSLYYYLRNNNVAEGIRIFIMGVFITALTVFTIKLAIMFLNKSEEAKKNNQKNNYYTYRIISGAFFILSGILLFFVTMAFTKIVKLWFNVDTFSFIPVAPSSYVSVDNYKNKPHDTIENNQGNDKNKNKITLENIKNMIFELGCDQVKENKFDDTFFSSECKNDVNCVITLGSINYEKDEENDKIVAVLDEVITCSNGNILQRKEILVYLVPDSSCKNLVDIRCDSPIECYYTCSSGEGSVSIYTKEIEEIVSGSTKE